MFGGVSSGYQAQGASSGGGNSAATGGGMGAMPMQLLAQLLGGMGQQESEKPELAEALKREQPLVQFNDLQRLYGRFGMRPNP